MICSIGGEKFFTLLCVWFIVVLVILVKRNRNFLKKKFGSIGIVCIFALWIWGVCV